MMAARGRNVDEEKEMRDRLRRADRKKRSHPVAEKEKEKGDESHARRRDGGWPFAQRAERPNEGGAEKKAYEIMAGAPAAWISS